MTNLVRTCHLLALLASLLLTSGALRCRNSDVCAANLVLQDTVERIFSGNRYFDVPRGLYLVRGENVVLMGEIVSLARVQSHRRDLGLTVAPTVRTWTRRTTTPSAPQSDQMPLLRSCQLGPQRQKPRCR